MSSPGIKDPACICNGGGPSHFLCGACFCLEGLGLDACPRLCPGVLSTPFLYSLSCLVSHSPKLLSHCASPLEPSRWKTPSSPPAPSASQAAHLRTGPSRWLLARGLPQHNGFPAPLAPAGRPRTCGQPPTQRVPCWAEQGTGALISQKVLSSNRWKRHIGLKYFAGCVRTCVGTTPSAPLPAPLNLSPERLTVAFLTCSPSAHPTCGP